jgi:hypothetical protein
MTPKPHTVGRDIPDPDQTATERAQFRENTRFAQLRQAQLAIEH